MSKSIKNTATASKINGMITAAILASNGKVVAPVAVAPVALSAGQKAAATKLRMKQEAVAAAELEAQRIASMTPGQKAAATKLRMKQAAVAPVAPVAVAPADTTITADTMTRLLALAPMLRQAGLI